MKYTQVKTTPIFGIQCDDQEPAHWKRKGERELGGVKIRHETKYSSDNQEQFRKTKDLTAEYS
jgi:hypothetical protein